MLNALSVIAALLIVAQRARGLGTQDIVVEWTSEGKKLTLQIPAPTGRFYANERVDNPIADMALPMMRRTTSCPP